jgi:predicted nuclease of predicted toxin-antitoxin system
VNLLIDMNLSPSWVQALEERGHSAVHWSTIGQGNESDSTLLGWARDNGYVVFTNDLDFGAILAATGGRSPSVIQVRAQDLTPDHLVAMVAQALSQHENVIEAGALIAIDEFRSRVRILPLRSDAG